MRTTTDGLFFFNLIGGSTAAALFLLCAVVGWQHGDIVGAALFGFGTLLFAGWIVRLIGLYAEGKV